LVFGQPCTIPRDCDDGNECTSDICAANGICSNDFYTCDDFDACTQDECNPAFGCLQYAIACSDNDDCTTDNCDPSAGCIYTPICDDNDPCTSNNCDPTTLACSYVVPTDCNDNNICTTDSCDPTVGCIHSPKCDDTDPCTSDSCDSTGSCTHTPCPDCVSSSSGGIDTLCNGTTRVQSLDAGSITTGALTVTGSKKRGLAGVPSFIVEGGAMISGGLTTTTLETTTFVTQSVTVTGSLMITTVGGGSSSFDLSKGISTGEINCTSLDVTGSSTLTELVTTNTKISNKLTAKDATLTGTLNLPFLHFVPQQNQQLPWLNMDVGTIFSVPDNTANSAGFKIYAVGKNAQLFEVPLKASQLGTVGQPCFYNQCQSGLVCLLTGICNKKPK